MQQEISNPSTHKAVTVYVRLMFLRIGEIDTLNEKYQAQAAIESRWPIEIDKISLNLSSDDQKHLTDGKSISLPNYAEFHWYPQLYIENNLGDLKEQIRYSAKKSKTDDKIYICEHRDIKGLFWEKLELQHFPSDVQDLSISIASMLYDDKVVLMADPYRVSGVNREVFVDQQAWKLYEHVDSAQRFIKEFIFQGDEDYDDDDDNLGVIANNNEGRKRSVLTVTSHAARRSNYFFWNGYCLILLITLLSFAIFAMPPHLTANRIQASCTLLLTSITFRWTVNRSLPPISYLTSMDIYALFCILTLIILCLWHAVMSTIIFQLIPDLHVTPDMWIAHLDHWAFINTFSIFICIHIAFLIWLYFVPLKLRRDMSKKDIDYRRSIVKDKKYLTYTPIPI